jgi:ribulose-phosphate 3-epimerase
MSVNPGFGAQRFLPNALRKIRTLDRRRRELGLPLPIEIDGGINLDNLGDVVRAGCDWIVAGSTIFDSADPTATVRTMQQIVKDSAAVSV